MALKPLIKAAVANPRLLVAAAGFALLIAGIAAIYWPAALITAGGILLAEAYAAGRPARPPVPPTEGKP